MEACVQTTEKHVPQPPHGLGGMREAKTNSKLSKGEHLEIIVFYFYNLNTAI